MKKWKMLLIFLFAFPLYAVTRITLTLDANVIFDLSLVIYPPYLFPTYYYPSQASAVNPQGISLTVGYLRLGPTHSVSNLYLATRGSGDFSTTIGLDQLFFAPDGEPLPAPGIDPPGGNWRPFSISYQEIGQFAVSGVVGRFRLLQDYIFKAEADDEPGNWTITLYYRLYGL